MEPTGIQIAGALGGLGFQEILIIAVVAIILFGGKKIGDVGKGLGEGIRNFKTSLKGDDEKDEKKRDEEKVGEKK